MAVKKLRMVIGNHWSDWGINDILERLQRDLFANLNVEITFFPSEDAVNIFLEDFSSKEYVEEVMNCRNSKNVLICSEFISERNGKKRINEFLVSRSDYVRSLISRQISFREVISKVFSQFLITKKSRYWKARRKNLNKLFKEDVFDLIITLHPEAFQCKNERETAVLNYFPVVQKPLKSPTQYRRTRLVTFGSMNNYRKKVIAELGIKLPLGILHTSYDDLKKIDDENITRFIDVYLRNSHFWDKTSPIRIASSLSRGIPVVLLDNLDNHPIISCCGLTNLESFSDIDDLILLARNQSKKSIDAYNDFARKQNRKVREALVSLIT
jgi:hypothetical protein